nr:YdeI/OmpD-associated family protein [uncultured Lacibacter sp.]
MPVKKQTTIQKKEVETFCPSSPKEWRKWLKQHHETKQSVWLLLYKTSSSKPSVSWSDAVDEALCFGWIDSVRKTIDAESFVQLFGKRKPKSGWSKINKDKVTRLTEEGLMTKAGIACVETAKQNGSWSLFDAAEELKIPADLTKAFKEWPGSKKYFLSISKSSRKAILQWLVLAKRAETRQKRIAEIAELAGRHMKPKQFM